MRSLVISIFLYACESWTFTAELEKRTQAFEMRCYRRLLNISHKLLVTNEEVRRKIQTAIGEYDELLTLVKKRKLRWFRHVSRSSGLAKTILHGGGGRVVRRCWVNFQCWGVLLIWIIVGQGSVALAVGAGGGCLDVFSLICPFTPLSPSLWETARYRLKYCLKGPLNPKQPTNQPSYTAQ